MKQTVIAILVAALLGGCSTPPKPVMPDGGSRTPVNTSAQIEEYTARSMQASADRAQSTALERQVNSMNRQLAELKTYMLMLEMDRKANQFAGGQVGQVAAVGQGAALPAKQAKVERTRTDLTGANAGESIEVRGQSVIFRLSHGIAKTEYKPSADFEAELLKAARQAQHIEIRGRTDAEFDNPIDRDIAMQRALRARKFLVSNGIEPSKIRWYYMSYGGHVADNKTPEGKNRNRRVEIETMDMDTTAYLQPAKPAPVKLGSAE